MNKEIKIIALIIVLGVFAFSGAFGANYKNVSILNNVKIAEATVFLMNESGESIGKGGERATYAISKEGISQDAKLKFRINLKRNSWGTLEKTTGDKEVQLVDGQGKVEDVFSGVQLPGYSSKVNATFKPSYSQEDTLLIVIDRW